MRFPHNYSDWMLDLGVALDNLRPPVSFVNLTCKFLLVYKFWNYILFCFQIPGASFSLIGPVSTPSGLQVSSQIQPPIRPSSLDDRKTSATLSNYMKPAQSSSGQLAIGLPSDVTSIQKASNTIYILPL